MKVGILGAAVVFGDCVQVNTSTRVAKGTVSISAFDHSGALVVKRELELLDRHTGRTLSKTRYHNFRNVPYGQYAIRVSLVPGSGRRLEMCLSMNRR
jgi:hypothetical protein